ncbi:MAG: DUF5715 family protein [Gemmatimonadota bacterium]
MVEWQTRRSANEVAEEEGTDARRGQRPGGVGSKSGFLRLSVTISVLLLGMAFLAYGWAKGEREAAVEAAREETRAEIEAILTERIDAADRLARSADRVLSPLPVMTPGEEAVLRRFLNASHLARARQLGVRAEDEDALDSLVAAGRLIELEDSTEYWIVRPGTSPAHVVPDLRTLLEVLGTRFQGRLAEMGLPPYRVEVTSALRTAERQARLRRNNANAAAGVSSHEFGTTVDLSYAAFAPPAEVPAEIMDGVAEDLRPHIRRIADLAFESVSARKSRELGRIFGQVLAEAQDEGIALVIYERQQTVYHLTLGRAM